MEDRTEYAEADILFNENIQLAKDTLYKVFPKPKYSARKKGLDEEDLLQYCYTGLWLACLSYDPSKNTKFRTHAINNIRWHLIERYKRECSPIKLEINRKYKPEELPMVRSMDIPSRTFSSGGTDEVSTLHDFVPSDILVAEDDAMDYLAVDEYLSYANSSEEVMIVKLRMQGKEYKEIGEILGKKTHNVRTRAISFRDRVRKHKELVEVV